MREQRIITILFLISLTMAFLLPVYNLYFLQPAFTKFLLDESEDHALDIGRHLADMLAPRLQVVGEDAFTPEIKGEIENALKNFHILKLKIFSATGRVVFSTKPEDVGTFNTESYFHEVVARGKTYLKIVEKGGLSAEGRKYTADVVEAYIPFVRNGEFLGAFEIYQDFTDKKETVDILMHYSSAFLLAVALGFLTVILVVSARARRAFEKTGKAQAELRQSEEQYRSLVEAAQDIIVHVDREARVTFVNRYASHILGYPVEEITGRKVWEFISPRDRRKVRELYETASLGKTISGMEISLKARDGRTIDFEVKSMPVFTENEFQGSRAILRDITERKRAYEKEMDLLRELKTIFENIPIGIAYIDRDYDFLNANRFFCSLLGVEEKGLIGKPCYEAVGKVLDFLTIGECCETGNPAIMERAIGRLRVRTMMVPEKDDTGKIIRFLVIAQDVTEQKQAEEDLRASLAEKEVLLKEIHHRVKNNLQIISSLLHLQSRNIEDEEFLSMFRESQGRVKSMALIHESLYQSGDLARVDIEKYMRRLTSNLLRSFGADTSSIALEVDIKGISLSVDLAVPCGLIVNELVSNSLKYAFPGGRRGEVRVSLAEAGDSYTLEVTDDGVGLPEGMDIRNTETLGLKLVLTLIDQLEGTFEYKENGKTGFMVKFKDPQHKHGR